MPTNVRRASFWIAVAVTAQLSNLALEILADRVKSPGLAGLIAYVHRGKEA